MIRIKRMLTVFSITYMILITVSFAKATSLPTANELDRAIKRATNKGVVDTTISLSGDLAAEKVEFSVNSIQSNIDKCTKEKERPGFFCYFWLPGDLEFKPDFVNDSEPVKIAEGSILLEGRIFIEPSTTEWTISYARPIKLKFRTLICKGISSCIVKYDVPSLSEITALLPKQYEIARPMGEEDYFTINKVNSLHDCKKQITGIDCSLDISGVLTRQPINDTPYISNSSIHPYVSYVTLNQPLSIVKMNDNSYQAYINRKPNGISLDFNKDPISKYIIESFQPFIGHSRFSKNSPFNKGLVKTFHLSPVSGTNPPKYSVRDLIEKAGNRLPGGRQEILKSGKYSGGLILTYPSKNIYMDKKFSAIWLSISTIRFIFDDKNRLVKVIPTIKLPGYS